MKAKQFSVATNSNSIYEREAAEFINTSIAASHGTVAFDESDEYAIRRLLEAEIASCEESIRTNLFIEIEEIEIDDEEL